jgi:DNA-binding beta-propeller fold protein YncE
MVVPLPGLTEGVGINYNPKREEVYIPYDNHPSVHVVDFKTSGTVHEIKIPTYGNDASAIDEAGSILYVSCWGYGEIEVINLETRLLVKRIRDVGIIPHMFSMTFNPNIGRLIIPIGASAVNGSFGSALTVLDPVSEKMQKIYTGWAPVALAEMKSKEGFLVFNSEDEAAEVTPDGTFKRHHLPCQFANNAIKTPSGNIYVSYGPHQSYWPVVYIWAAKNGILGIDPDTMTFYDRRIPRMAHQMTLDKDGVLYLLQNNWGLEKQFLFTLPDEVRNPNLDQSHVELGDMLLRETTQRILKYDAQDHRLYIVRVGETDDEAGILQIYDLASQKVLLKYPVGLSPTDLVFDDMFIYITAFDSDTIAVVDKDDFSVHKIKTGEKPFKMALMGRDLYVINHDDNSLQVFGKEPGTYPLPCPGRPDAIFDAGGSLIITAHSPEALNILSFSPASKSFETIHRQMYPYGETTVDTDNSSFYLRGQFGDGIFEINQIKQDRKGRLWITDFLSGKLFIVSDGQKPF